MSKPDRAQQIMDECVALASMLIEKNAAYGDSALNPVRVFSRADPVEQLRVRIDDKLSRLMRGSAAGEDVVLDLLGYLVLLRIATRTLKLDMPEGWNDPRQEMEMMDLERRLRADAQANLDIEKKAHEITRGMLAASAQRIVELSGDGRAEAVGADAVPVIPSDT